MIDYKDRVESIFAEVNETASLIMNSKVTKPRKWKGEKFPIGQIPIATVFVSGVEVFAAVPLIKDIAAKNHVSTMIEWGERQKNAKILVYIQLKKNEIQEIMDEKDAKVGAYSI